MVKPKVLHRSGGGVVVVVGAKKKEVVFKRGERSSRSASHAGVAGGATCSLIQLVLAPFVLLELYYQVPLSHGGSRGCPCWSDGSVSPWSPRTRVCLI